VLHFPHNCHDREVISAIQGCHGLFELRLVSPCAKVAELSRLMGIYICHSAPVSSAEARTRKS
jgi:hypothetical protein